MLTDASRARDFPSLADRVYLNTAAEGIPPLVVRDALTQYFADKQLGMDGREPHFEQLSQLKSLIGEFYGLSPSETAVCSCSSEAYNLAAIAMQLQEGDEVVVNDLDFPAGVTPWMQASNPATVKVWRSRNGALFVDDLKPLLSSRTRLVTTSLVSFFNGFLLPLDQVRDVVRSSSDALLSVDVTQALGRIPLELSDVDLIVSSTHKWILASHGGGLVGVPSSRSSQLTVPAGGWLHLQDAFAADRFERPATSLPGAAGFAVGMPNFPAVYAIRAALDYIRSVGVQAIADASAPLVQHCITELSRMPIDLLTPVDQPIAGIIAFRHPEADQIHKQLLQKNIHVMAHAGRLRIAIHGYNTHSDIEFLLGSLRELV
ncbi:MAG: aminotransferase class V-fold PLP-dependent enzyme [Planctomycetaceae bacterium]|nr:aminotransferase class V-fold PLP-dependent enzyme [Planctomycetaceae bacterium]